jgi:Ca2+/H+ antiporter, TMEM165/GDT1 family
VDALLTSFIAAGLAEIGDRTQLLAALLAARYGRPGPILLGVGLGALIHMALAAIAGAFVNDFVPPATNALLLAVLLAFAGLIGLFARTPPDEAVTAGSRPFWAAFTGAFALEFADKSQFLTFGLAAWTDQPALTAAGATAGILAACLPAVALGARFADAVPLTPLRVGAAGLFLLTAAIVAVSALGLI